jgi:hypothetical protein
MKITKARFVVTIIAVAMVLALLPTLSTVASRTLFSPGTAPPLPGMITYQGRLVDKSTGNLVADGVYDMVFSIYDDPDPAVTTPLWSQKFAGVQGVAIQDGQFTVMLGGVPAPFPLDLFAGQPLWLGIQVGADPEMEPRTRLASVPYASTAETLRAGGTTSESMAGTVYKFSNTDPAGYALVSEGRFHVQGDAHVEGALTWATQTGHISIPAAAFEAGSDLFTYYNDGGNLYSTYGTNFFAPVQLPDGSTVTKVTFYFYDDTAAGNVTATLYRLDLGFGVVYSMASVTSSDGGYGSDYDDSISYAQVDNESNAYYLYAAFGAYDADLQVRAVVIEYEFTRPY